MVLQHVTTSNCLQLPLCCCARSGLRLSIKHELLYHPQGPRFGFLPGSNLEQANRFSKWGAGAQKDQLRFTGCALDSVSSSFQKPAIRYSCSKAWEAQLGLKKPACGAGHWVEHQAPELQIDAFSQILIPTMDKLQLAQVFHHFWESHQWQYKSCHRALEVWPGFWKKQTCFPSDHAEQAAETQHSGQHSAEVFSRGNQVILEQSRQHFPVLFPLFCW